VRNGAKAIIYAEKAVAATNRKDPTILDTLAAAYAEGGQFGKSVDVEQEAIGLLETEDDKKDYDSHLKLF
jgi:hypothetical protein